jgi:Zn-dependent protease
VRVLVATATKCDDRDLDSRGLSADMRDMRLATIAGIPIRVHWSFLAFTAFFALTSLIGQGWIGLVTTLLTGGALFGFVVLHELGHALAARYFGIRTDNITLYPFGGIAAIQRMPTEPKQELVIALAGPAVNLGLAVVFGTLWFTFGGYALAVLFGINVVMALFNLTPAFPMDGGRVLRALLAGQMGWFRASELSLKIGTGFAWLFVIIAVVTFQWSLGLVGLFLFIAIRTERRRLTFTRHQARAHWGWTTP